MLAGYVEQIQEIARESRTEGSLQIRLEALLSETLERFGVVYRPSVNEALRSQGLGRSRVDSTRPDSLFGHVVLDYKAPGLLASPNGLVAAKQQIEGYLSSVAEGPESADSRSWAGVLWDGHSLAFCHSDGRQWRWSALFEVSTSSLLTLIQTYRGLQRRPLTAPLLAFSFGRDSAVARELLTTMCSHLSKPRHRTTMLFREWKRLFQQVSTYGLDQLPSLKRWSTSLGIATKDASQLLFAIHSYYALVVKLLTSELLAAVNPVMSESLCERMANAPNDEELYRLVGELENGEYWKRLRISNFLEGDFFSWYTNERSRHLAKGIQTVARQFLEFEPATAIVRPEAIKDLLKEFYTTLVEEQLRHDLGEYYTPDWLAERVLDRTGWSGGLDTAILDPACGSGTFLVESISRMRRTAREAGVGGRELLRALLDHVKGTDLNPLAVISARANYILAIADLIFEVGDDVELPVYLADCINVPKKIRAVDGIEVLQFPLDTEIDTYAVEIPTCLVNAGLLGKILLTCEDAIRAKRDSEAFLKSLRTIPNVAQLLDARVELRLLQLFKTIQALEQHDWNRIWCRIVKNSFSPAGFSQVDLLVGNPPWVRWSRLPESYRERVKGFCAHYGLVSGRGYSGGIETDISTVVLYSAADHWLRVGGTVGFLITWTVFKSASARGFRLGVLPDGSGLRLTETADLRRIQPFPDATNETAIYVARKVDTSDQSRFTAVPHEIWTPAGSARIDPKTALNEVLSNVAIEPGVACPVSDWGSPLWTGTSSEYGESSVLRGTSPYLQKAHRGTVSDLARVFWVKIERYAAATNRALIRTLRQEELPIARAVDPVHGAWIEADLLYPLIRGRDLGRYSVATDGWYQIVPNHHYDDVDSEADFSERYPLAYSYFLNYRELLTNRATYRRYQKHLPFYVIYCVGEYTFCRWKVAWMEQQDPSSFRCAVVSTTRHSVTNFQMIPDHKLYFAQLDSEQEAHYLCAYLNSRPVRAWLGGFLHGKQIGTSIFEFMYVPKFDVEAPDHRRLAAISLAAHDDRRDSRDPNLLRPSVEEELAEIVHRVASRR